jgi:hypothetical protein
VRNGLAGNVGDMSTTWQNVAYFRADRGNLATWFLVCWHTFVLQFSDIYVPQTDDIRMSVVLIPTLMVIYITAPPNKKPYKIICLLHPLASRPPPESSPHVAPDLFVWSSVCLFLWLVVASSLCPLSSRPIPSRRRATSLSSSNHRVVASRLASLLYRAS